MDHPSAADSSVSPAPVLAHAALPVDAELVRFSPLTALEREAVDSFCTDSRPWALRQARRSYRHLPEALREQAVDRAFAELRTRTPASVERRALAAELADRLTDALRHVHVGWCLNESSALLRREGTEPVQPEVRREDLAQFVDDGLGGLERAILQLEIGAGRDTRTSRAALRLNPRSYAAQRESGFSKLRDAISAQVIGRACDQHVSSIVAAATGDRAAMDSLSGGPNRCRYCAREAQGLRSVLHERLAIAPWPIAVKPAGLLAAKLGAVGALFGSKAGGAGAGAGALAVGSGTGSSASLAATVLAAAALATGTAAVVGHDATPRERNAGHGVVAKSTGGKAKTAAASAKSESGAGAKRAKASAKPAATHRRKPARTRTRNHASGGASTPSIGATTTASSGTTVASTGAGTTGSGSSKGTLGAATKPVTKTVDDTVKTVTDQLPAAVATPVQGVVDNVTDTVDDTVDQVGKLIP